MYQISTGQNGQLLVFGQKSVDSLSYSILRVITPNFSGYLIPCQAIHKSQTDNLPHKTVRDTGYVAIQAVVFHHC